MLTWLLAPAWGVDLFVGPKQAHPTLTSALAVAQPYDRILLDPGSYLEDVTIPATLSDVEIIGAGSDPKKGTRFDGGSGSTVWVIDGATNLVVRDLAIMGGDVLRPLIVQNGSTVTFEDVGIHDGYALGGGGAWVHDDADVTFRRVLFDGNVTEALYSGAGLRVETEGTALVEDCTFTGNTSGQNGAGLWSEGVLTVRGSTFMHNVAVRGGGLYCRQSLQCLVEDSLFQENQAERGGGIYVFQTDATFLRLRICGNVATGGDADAGAILFGEGSGTVTNSVILFNDADDDAGGVYVLDSTVDLVNNTLLGNVAGDVGGGVYLNGTSVAEFTNNLVTSNSAAGLPSAAFHVGAGAASGGYNLYWANTATDAFPGTVVTDVLADPGLLLGGRVCDADVTPDPLGPAVDAGDPAIADPDGSPSDIGATGGPDAIRDRDGDGYIDGAEDCDDLDAAVNPAAVEVCGGADEDCDGLTDDDDPDVTGTTTYYADEDSDGYGDLGAPIEACVAGDGAVADDADCNDDDPAVNPDAVEVCGGEDEDCDTLFDDDDPDVDPASQDTWWLDADGDGFGDDAQPVLACVEPPGVASIGGDCAAGDAAVNPGAQEVCDDGVDNDCVGGDEECVVDSTPTDSAPARDVASPDKPPAGCSCDAGGGGPGAFWIAVLALVRRS